jgi:uncharacterized SAM-binding protein YcdF (DUF218 family)
MTTSVSFLISKLAWALLAPGTLLFLLLASALYLQHKHPRVSRRLLTAATAFFGLLLLCPAGAWVLRPLEARFPAPTLNNQAVYGIIVLGLALDAEGTHRAGMPVLNDGAERLTTFVALARQYPQAKLVFSGGSGDIRAPDLREADQVKTLFSSLGLDPSRVIFERDSRNTYENALYSQAMVQPLPGQTWLLITSAWHTPRAVGCFEKAGWKVLPYPVDYRSVSNDHWAMFQADQQLGMVSVGVREWLGLLSYWLMGRTSTFLPSASTVQS